APEPLVKILLPLATKAAEAVTDQKERERRGLWLAIARSAPDGGPNYVNTHILASIARILWTASQEANIWR
ncbi:MAG TPA: hypothetical protein VE986_03520, partial [Hyphomicrobiales bacterium]|nr:hypothetical protein [Hyphomicrobiales bacterium]